MKPRVLFLDHTGVMGGAELFLLTLAERWVGEREVALFADGPFRERLEQMRVPVTILQGGRAISSVGRAGRGFSQVLAMPSIFKLARRVARHAAHFDVLFANSQKALIIGAIASRIAGKRLVWYLHDILTADHFSALNRSVSVKVGSRFASRVIANSKASEEAFVRCGGRLDRASVVYNGIDAHPFSCVAANEVARLRAEMGWGSELIAGVFSRVAPWKGQHVLLEAMPTVPNLRVIFVGAPLFGDEASYLGELKAKALELGVSDRIQFLGFRDDIPALMQAVDFVVHTSVSPEPFGRVIVEGMLSGKAVVATRAGGACEIIEDGETGCLIPPGDPTGLAAILRRLMEDPMLTGRLGHAARESAARRFSVAVMLQGIEREIELAIR